MKRKGHRPGLGKKLSLMLVACILLVSLGLVAITYSVYCRKVLCQHGSGQGGRRRLLRLLYAR